MNALGASKDHPSQREFEARREAREGDQMAKEDPRSAKSVYNDDVWTEELDASERYPNSRKLKELVRKRLAAQQATDLPMPDPGQPSDLAPEIPPPPPPHEAGRPSRPAKSPQTPSQKEADEHMLTHLPFQDWCEICVACRKANTPHAKTNEEHRHPPSER